jgi:hypothetical protein
MARILLIIAVLFGGAMAGLASVDFALDRQVSGDVVRAGPWEMRSGESLVTADPYERAERARSGAIPLASGEGFTMIARRDSRGEPLSGRCLYSVTGATPAARFWSLSLFDEQGRLVQNEAQRNSFNSTEVTRDAQGSFSIAVASQLQPGDWLPAPERGGFVMLLRLYDTPIGAGASMTSAQVPAIARLACG